jgi:heat shock protein 4
LEDLIVPTIVVIACGVFAVLVYRKSLELESLKRKSSDHSASSNKKSKTGKNESLLNNSENQRTMSVVGIDFGNLNTVVAVARNRGIDVIANETSNRATP